MGAEERRCHVFVFFSKFYNYNNETIARMSRFPSEAIISSAGVRLADRAITTWDATSMLWPTSVPALPCASEWCNCQLRDTSMDYENVKDGERKRHTIDYNKVCRFRILGYQIHSVTGTWYTMGQHYTSMEVKCLGQVKHGISRGRGKDIRWIKPGGQCHVCGALA